MNKAFPHSSERQFLENIYVQYRFLIMRIASKYIRNQDHLEDIFHEAFIKILRKAPLLRTLPPHKLEAYIILVTRGVCVDHFRKEHACLQADIPDDVLFSLLEKDAKNGHWGKVELSIMLSDFTAEERVLLIGRYCLELSIPELVDLVGGTQANVRTKLYRAKKRAYQKWSKQGLTLGDFCNE